MYVLDQEEALAFYRDKLGFEVRSDMRTPALRWLTVAPKPQPALEMALVPVDGPAVPAAAAATLRDLVRAGAFRVGVLETGDCRGTYAELAARGVEFQAPPTERFYGVEAIFKDNSGNWYTLVQRTKPG